MPNQDDHQDGVMEQISDPRFKVAVKAKPRLKHAKRAARP